MDSNQHHSFTHRDGIDSKGLEILVGYYPGCIAINDLNELNQFILALYRNTSRLSTKQFLSWSLDSFTRVVYFDSGVLGHSTPTSLIPYNMSFYHQTEEMLQSYLQVKELDPLLKKLRSTTPGKTLNFDDLIPKNEFNSHPLYLNHAKKFGIEYTLSTRTVEPLTGHSVFLTVYRANPDLPFNDRDCLFMEFVFPHIIEAYNQNILLHLKKESLCEEATNTGHALCDENGEIHTADALFFKLLKQEWNNWSGLKNRPEVMKILKTSADKRTFKGQSVVIRSYQSDNLFHLIVHKKNSLDALSPRETTIAKMISMGSSYKEISNELNISLSTVTKHMNNIYKKMGFKNKAELSYWMSKTH